MNTYLAFYNRQSYEIQADSLYAAKQKAILQLNIPKSKQGLLAIELVRVDNTEVTKNTGSI